MLKLNKYRRLVFGLRNDKEQKIFKDEIINNNICRDLEKGVFGRMCYLIDKYGKESESTNSKAVIINLDTFEKILKDEDFKDSFIKKIPEFVPVKLHNRIVSMGVLEVYLEGKASTIDSLIHSYTNPLKCMNKILHVKTEEELNKITFYLKII